VTPKDVIGFRAPYLAKGAGLYAVLKRNAFRYDTSGVSRSDAWPERIDGVWRFNLAMLRIAGSGRGTLSMDYNFLATSRRKIRWPRPEFRIGLSAENCKVERVDA
jgi:hypothetical protein